MDFALYSFRNALPILTQRPEWGDLKSVISAITRTNIMDAQRKLAAKRSQPPRGAQQAINQIFKERLSSGHWLPECRLFEGKDKELARWAMDFVKRGNPSSGSTLTDFGLGVEVTFNHSEAIAWTLIRLDLAAEIGVREEARIDVGIAIYPSRELKSWGKMDSAVGTFEQACTWLDVMKPVIPIPLLLIGLNPRDHAGAEDWSPSEAFPGTRKNVR